MNINNLKIQYKLLIGIVLNSIFTLIEFIIGFASGSLSLVSDASHNLTDVLSLVISLIASQIAKKQPNSKKTFGYGRASIFGALINGSILFILSGYIFHEAYKRWYYPEVVEGKLVMIVGFVGIILNGAIATLFIKNKDDINIKAALLNMIFDTLASAGALISGIVILLTGKTYIDPIMSCLIGVLLLISSLRVLKTVINILFEGVPSHISHYKVKKHIESISGVIAVDDLHIWAISSHYTALTCHIVVADNNLEAALEIIKKIKKDISDLFSIKHSTIEVEANLCKNSQCMLINK